MGEAKERLDILLVNKGFFQSRERAKASIMAGDIFIDGVRVDKAGERVKVMSNIEVRGKGLKYVSRGGLKLEKAMDEFHIDLKEKVTMDVGASTGGFTDCMLQNGAVKVFSVDVGYGQFAWKLRIDPRVECMERTNIRYVEKDTIGMDIDFSSIDVSFISLKKVIPKVVELLGDKGEVVALIKPQFEAGREKVGKKGVVREASTHKEVIECIVNYLKEINMNVLNLSFSPIKGPEGNIEYLVYFSKDSEKDSDFYEKLIDEIVSKSHENL